MAYYDVLGLDSQCTGDEIKKAYRRLAIKVSQAARPAFCRLSPESVDCRAMRDVLCKELELMIVTSRQESR